MFHRQHISGAQDHIHFGHKNQSLYAMNRDGSAHDGSHGERLSNRAVDFLRTDFADFKIPKKKVIEQGELLK